MIHQEDKLLSSVCCRGRLKRTESKQVRSADTSTEIKIGLSFCSSRQQEASKQMEETK